MKLMLVLSTLLLAGQVAAAEGVPNPAIARCEQAAQAWFGGAYPNGQKTLKSGRTVKASQTAHYNSKRMHCMVRVESTTEAQGKSPALANLAIHNLNATNQKIIASLIRVRDKATHCVVEGKKCQSADEWNKLAAPLMQE